MTIREAIENIELYLVELIEERRSRISRRDKIIRSFLFMGSQLYRGITQVRLYLYRERLLHQDNLGCLVVSIGNLTCGGTGKTPVVEVFAETLAKEGRRVAILSRGYRSKSRPFWRGLKDRLGGKGEGAPAPRVVSDGKRLLMDSAAAGDEPYMLAGNLPDVAVIVDKDRAKAGRHAIRRLGCDTLILDDGFQYLRLNPRLNILLVDSSSPFHNHHLLPRGLLREPIKNLRRADFVFLTKSSGSSKLRHLKDFIKKHNPKAEIIECTHKPQYLENVYTGERFDLNYLRGRRVAAVSGIARPEGFENFLTDLGGKLVYKERFMDHHRYRQQELIDFINRSLGKKAKLILTTEKDTVRFPKLDRRDLPIYFLRVKIDIISGRENFNACVQRICFNREDRSGERNPSISGDPASVVAPSTNRV